MVLAAIVPVAVIVTSWSSAVMSVLAPDAAAPISVRDHATLAEPSNVLPVEPIVSVRAIASVAALPPRYL